MTQLRLARPGLVGLSLFHPLIIRDAMTSTRISSWFQQSLPPLSLSLEKVLFALLLILAVLTRFYDLGTRVISHDESIHVYYSYLLSQGQGYFHTPLSHGPLQFHLIALLFFLFEANDFVARIPHALASILTIALIWKWRLYLGRAGTLLAAFLLLISPYMLYYGRYARNEAFVALFGVLTLYAILRYLETGHNRYLLLLTLATVLHFTAKETSFIYTAQALLFLAALLVLHLLRQKGVLQNWQTLSTWLRQERAFDLLILLGTLVLPHLSAFPAHWLGWNPLEYQFTWPGWNLPAIFAQAPARTALVVSALTLIALGVGLLWDARRFLLHAALFWGIYIFFYTTIFTNPAGLATGVVGSLGYWLEQHGVERGGQPWYYYLLIQIPLYEFLPALGSLLALALGLRSASHKTAASNAADAPASSPVFALLVWWSFSSLAAYTIAGEKMPWLTVHIAWPMILLTAWGLNRLIETVPWREVWSRHGLWATLLLGVLLLALTAMLFQALGAFPPFQGKSQAELIATGRFLFWTTIALGSAVGLYFLTANWPAGALPRLGILILFGLLSLVTARTAFRAAYVNYDWAGEYLVYAHGARGVKEVIAQLDLISRRTTGGFNELIIRYDASTEVQGVSWPLKWYLRNFPNAEPFYEMDKSLSQAPVVLVDPQNYDQAEALFGDAYYHFEYQRMVWPNQDYFKLTWPRLRQALFERPWRAAIFDIWWKRDFTRYSALTNNPNLTFARWQPSKGMRLYVQKETLKKVWEYNLLQQAEIRPDPYEAGMISLLPELTIGSSGPEAGQFAAPHGMAIAPDGSLYVADTNNHRIQHFAADGTFLNQWGSFGDVMTNQAPAGTFNQPWDVAVSPDGSYVYVLDTWNHRVQKFTAQGQPVGMWGTPNYHVSLGNGYELWGPRGIAIDRQGRVYVADTGNKRVVIYDADGNFLSQFGGGGMAPGQLDEPVGIAVDDLGRVYVADTWNQRIQVFESPDGGQTWAAIRVWEVQAWYGDTLENKPFLALGPQGTLLVTDPEAGRILQFTTEGIFVRGWGDRGFGAGRFGLASGVAVDTLGRVWISDAGNNVLSRFRLP
ncbi:MAG: TIGR03663 family protein [Anaerolineales bacterium]|nr:TIGR03663 family protein [Anaerolineales bacterium]